MSNRGSHQPRDWGAWMDHVDWVRVVRGASTGFSVLVISGLVNPIFIRINPTLGLVLLVVGAVAAFVVAAWRAREAEGLVLSGAIAALLSYTLVVPLIYITRRTLDYKETLIFVVVALVVGAASGYVLERRRSADK